MPTFQACDSRGGLQHACDPQLDEKLRKWNNGAKELKAPAILLEYRTISFFDRRVLTWGLHHGHHNTNYRQHFKES